MKRARSAALSLRAIVRIDWIAASPAAPRNDAVRRMDSWTTITQRARPRDGIYSPLFSNSGSKTTPRGLLVGIHFRNSAAHSTGVRRNPADSRAPETRAGNGDRGIDRRQSYRSLGERGGHPRGGDGRRSR